MLEHTLKEEVFSILYESSHDKHSKESKNAFGDIELKAEIANFEVGTSSLSDTPRHPVPDMWSKDFVGLYCQYAAIGLLYGSGGTLIPFCVYSYDGPTNVCANSKNIVFFAWSIKIFYAVFTDMFRPFGMRRKPYMLAGWAMVLLLLLVLAISADSLSISGWLIILLFVQCFAMLSDVPADGYTVELGHLEPFEQRGQILATAQRIRFTACVFAGILQMLLLNGPSTNDSGCEISFTQCWSWGLTVNQYYGLLFAIIFLLTIPILWLKELDHNNTPAPEFDHFVSRFWLMIQNLTTFYLIIFVIGIHSFTNFNNNASIALQYYVIKLTNFQIGLDTVTTFAALVAAIWLFQKYLINRNWRWTQYGSTLFAAVLGLVWIAPYYDSGGTMNGWFTIFIDMDKYFVQGLTQVLYSMAVIELALPGQEATTLEFIITVGNAALTVNGIISTQLLTPLNAVGCDDDNCPSDTVDVSNKTTYDNSNGPSRFTNYTLVLCAIAITATMVFTPFLPASKEECYEWKKKGEEVGSSKNRAYGILFMSFITIGYGLSSAILLLDVTTSCEPAIGGSGC